MGGHVVVDEALAEDADSAACREGDRRHQCRPEQGDDRPAPHRPRGDPSAAEDEEATDQRQPDDYGGRHGVAGQLDRDAADHQERRDPGGRGGSGMARQAGKGHDRRAQQQ
jgi:hypothetical protein